MFIEINYDDTKPIYLQLKEQIIAGIAKGSLKPGESLPSVRVMANDIGMNLHTVNKAYQQLKLEGFIEIQKKIGVKINANGIKKADETYIHQLEESVHPLIAEAICRQVSEQEFTNICHKVYKEFKQGGSQ